MNRGGWKEGVWCALAKQEQALSDAGGAVKVCFGSGDGEQGEED